MKFSYNWIQSFFDKPLPKPQELAELLTLRSFEVEEIEKRNGDSILGIDILPNRAHDCLSHLGLAREISALTNAKLKISFSRHGSLGFKNKNPLQIKADRALCPRYAAFVLEGIKIKDSPDWVKERLASMEQKPINNIVDITNYVMWDLGQPLHAFDFSKIVGAKMNLRASRRGEKLETLDGTQHDLGEGTIIIEDEKRIIDLAGIKGGANTQIDDNTTAIIFQAAIFDPMSVRKAVQKLGISTDAAVRYIHGFDRNLPSQALELAIVLLKETNPDAKIVGKIDIYPNPQKNKKIAVDARRVNSVLGSDISKKAMEQILGRLGFGIASFSKGFVLRDMGPQFRVDVPSYRLDINISEDVVEEIGRIYGYENIVADSPSGILISPRCNENIFWRAKARDILSGFGFSEAYNYSMIANELVPLRGTTLRVANPTSEELRYLRPALWPGILRNINTNKKYFDSIKIFEIGKVFSRDKDNIIEKENCAFAFWDAADRGAGGGFYKIKGYLDEFLRRMGITDFYYDPAFDEKEEKRFCFLHAGRRANILLNGKKCGIIGEINPGAKDAHKSGGRDYIAEFDFEWMRQCAQEEHIYQRPSKYPEVVRDIAILVPRDTMVVEALNAINSVSGPLLRDIDLFDMFSAQGGSASGGEGGNWPEGMKSLAFHLIFQSDERTLTSQEIDEIMSQITKALEEKLWEVR